MAISAAATRPRIIYISHGGGPLPLLGDPGHREMIDTLQAMAAEIGRPRAIVVISAHWEMSRPTLLAPVRPSLLYDYYGFPEESYAISYPAPGEPRLAAELATLLQQAGLPTARDEERGFDHGVFVPLKIMYPEADIPLVQLSLLADLDPGTHLQLGEALAPLNHPDLLVIGSGFSFHNMRAFFTADTSEATTMNQAFDHWLIETCGSRELEERERRKRLLDWQHAPHARYCHPREEHLLPLHVCYGMAGRACTRAYSLQILGKQSSMFLW